MVRPIVVWEEGNKVLSSEGGLGIIRTLVDQLPLGLRLNRNQIPENLRPDIGLLAQGKSDFDHTGHGPSASSGLRILGQRLVRLQVLLTLSDDVVESRYIESRARIGRRT